MCEKMSAVLSENMNYLNDQLKVNQNFDVVYRVIRIGGREACMYFIDGFCKDELMQTLKDQGYGSIVVETVNANTLASFVKEQMAEHGEELPDWLSEVVSTYEKVSVGVRKG